jgi:ADP-heptose:LPS heptosyltransferase
VFFRPKGKKVPSKVLFIELSEMGSAILADPAMRLVKERYNAELFFLIFKKNKPSLELLETVPESNIFTIEPSLSSLLTDTLNFLKWARKKKIDTVFDIELFSRFTALLAGFSGADNIAGFYRYHNEGLYRGEMLTHKVAYNHYQHISKNFINLINSIGEDRTNIPLSKSRLSDVVLAKAEITKLEKIYAKNIVNECIPVRHRDKKIVLVNANASDLLPQRRWPKERFVEFNRIVLKKHDDIIILLTGTEGERALADEIAAGTESDRCVNFTGKLSLKGMLGLYAISAVMLTNDSGPAHFSAVTYLPTVTLFGPETPLLYGPLGEGETIFLGLSCSPCVSATNHRKTSCRDNACLLKIEAPYVAKLVSHYIK